MIIIFTFPSAPFSVQSILNIPLLRLFLWPWCALQSRPFTFAAGRTPGNRNIHGLKVGISVIVFETSCPAACHLLKSQLKLRHLHFTSLYFNFLPLILPSNWFRNVEFPVLYHCSSFSHKMNVLLSYIYMMYVFVSTKSQSRVVWS